jgi:hypothetical protein
MNSLTRAALLWAATLLSCEVPNGGIGMSCVVDTECVEPGLICNSFSKTCLPRSHADELVCLLDRDCIDGLTCVPVDEAGTCRLVIETGSGPCLTHDDCALDALCDVERSVCVGLGEQRAGEPCATDRMCRNGLVCDAAASTCMEPGAGGIGTTCATSVVCARGLTCSRAPNDVGGSCLAEHGTSCTDDPECDPNAGLVCRPDHDRQWACQDKGAVLDSCAENEDCESGLRCGPNGLCQQLEGADCTTTSECNGAVCRPATHSPAARKQCLPLAGPGEPCTEVGQCRLGSVGDECLVERGQCPGAEGHVCTGELDCSGTLACLPNPGAPSTCGQPRHACSSCDTDHDCSPVGGLPGRCNAAGQCEQLLAGTCQG